MQKTKQVFDTTRERSLLMAKIKSNNTIPEILLRKALWKKNLRYRLKNKKYFGNPDIIIKKYKIVIFVDGAFWHGYKWAEKKNRIKANRVYWISKIERNIERDILINKFYADGGWNIFRFWDEENCASKIFDAINRQKNNSFSP